MYEYHKTAYPVEMRCEFTDYRIDDFPSEWLFDTEHITAWEEWHEQLSKMYADVLVQAIKHGCVGIRRPDSKVWYYVHNSTRGSFMQVTCWDDQGPVGHADVASGDSLAREIGWHAMTVYKMAA